ncbi:Fc receptor-like protein 4 [Melospiza georgiana]|uniref:Fc receptor-like protein 4 n=1 Tax=Melospiza georgiana TaxID=44398 RepID=UPI0025AD9C2E|nr:Fc receptor-like protein 4 [Melospiza georgiana]
MARKVALLLWTQTLSLAGAQTTQLVVDPPWRLAVLWDRVTLTCQGSGTASATTWYKDGWRRWQQGQDHLIVTERGTYTCERPGTKFSPSVSVLKDWLVLQVPAQALLEGHTLTLRCRCRQDNHLTRVQFYREEKDLGRSLKGTTLSLSPLQLHHSGRYRCEGLVGSWQSRLAAPVTVKVHRVPPSGVSLSAQPPRVQVALGDRLMLSCAVAMGTGPLSFSWHREGSGALSGTGPCLVLHHVGDNDSGQYRCRVSDGDSVAESVLLNVTVLLPVANATIMLGPLLHQERTGDNVTLHCSVQVGSAPVTFTWLHNGQEVAQGPLLELRAINVGHSGTSQCMATNQLGQDGHRVFWALSPELSLEVTPGSPWVTVATGVGGALLFLLLRVSVTWHLWHSVAARKKQERAPPDLLAPLEEGEVLYTHVVVTKRAGASSFATSVQDPQVTYVKLRGPQGQLQELGCCPQSPTGALTTQILVEPSWTPLVLWDQVTLTCQGSGTSDATTWYKDRRHLWQERQERFTVTESGTYWCDRPGTGRSPLVIVLQQLFSVPVLKGPPELTVGSPLAVSCLRTPSPLRPRAPLLHVFCWEGR